MVLVNLAELIAQPPPPPPGPPPGSSNSFYAESESLALRPIWPLQAQEYGGQSEPLPGKPKKKVPRDPDRIRAVLGPNLDFSSIGWGPDHSEQVGTVCTPPRVRMQGGDDGAEAERGSVGFVDHTMPPQQAGSQVPPQAPPQAAPPALQKFQAVLPTVQPLPAPMQPRNKGRGCLPGPAVHARSPSPHQLVPRTAPPGVVPLHAASPAAAPMCPGTASPGVPPPRVGSPSRFQHPGTASPGVPPPRVGSPPRFQRRGTASPGVPHPRVGSPKFQPVFPRRQIPQLHQANNNSRSATPQMIQRSCSAGSASFGTLSGSASLGKLSGSVQPGGSLSFHAQPGGSLSFHAQPGGSFHTSPGSFNRDVMIGSSCNSSFQIPVANGPASPLIAPRPSSPTPSEQGSVTMAQVAGSLNVVAGRAVSAFMQRDAGGQAGSLKMGRCATPLLRDQGSKSAACLSSHPCSRLSPSLRERPGKQQAPKLRSRSPQLFPVESIPLQCKTSGIQGHLQKSVPTNPSRPESPEKEMPWQNLPQRLDSFHDVSERLKTSISENPTVSACGNDVQGNPTRVTIDNMSNGNLRDFFEKCSGNLTPPHPGPRLCRLAAWQNEMVGSGTQGILMQNNINVQRLD